MSFDKLTIMDMLSCKAFFNLEDFDHKEIFLNQKYCWEALLCIKSYLNRIGLGKIESDIPSNCCIENRNLVSIGKNCIIHPFSFIKGPCIIGDNCEIRHGSFVRENVITGNNVVIGHSTEVKNSIFFNGAKASHFAYIGDSILGNRVNLGAGVKCANFKLSKDFITISYQGQKLDTGLKKMGAIIGDNSQIGCNTVTNPGTLISPNCLCYPNIVINGFIPENSTVKFAQHLKVGRKKDDFSSGNYKKLY